MTPKRIGILVVAYNAASTLATVLDRIPESFRGRITKVLVGDDASQDSTHLVALGYQQLSTDLPLEVIRHPRNLGYGGNQKAGYHWAIDQDLDIVVMLHADGQYAPESLPAMVAPLERGEADAVFGSRMLDEGAARRGGMPLYKYVGNKILTRIENVAAGTSLSEWHSGYRAYSVAALRDLPFDRNHDDFDFDTQIIVQLIEAGKRIVEIPIPTYYGDEICHVNGLGYARDVTRDVLRYRAHKMGFGSGELAFNSEAYELKEGPGSSHDVVLRWLRDRPAGRILDLGCSDGVLAERLREAGHHVTGVDLVAHEGVKERVDRFIEADLDLGIPPEAEGPFDVVLAADVLEHVRHPDRILDQIARAARRRAVRSSPACRTSVTGTRGCGWRWGGSTTTGAASSTRTTSGSSPGPASSASRRGPASGWPGGRAPVCPSRWSTGEAAAPTPPRGGSPPPSPGWTRPGCGSARSSSPTSSSTSFGR